MHSNLDNGGFPDDFYFTNLNMTLLDVIEVIIKDVGGGERYPTILTRSAVITYMYMTLHVLYMYMYYRARIMDHVFKEDNGSMYETFLYKY